MKVILLAVLFLLLTIPTLTKAEQDTSNQGKCDQKDLTPTGSPCPSGGISWKAIRPTEYVPGHDITSKVGMTVESCRDFCWSYPGCVSADITNAGVCYLNYAKTPIATSPIFSLLEFECCNEKPEPKCTFLRSQAGNSGPCFSSTAKFLDYKPVQFVAGHDLKKAYGQTVESCRQLCWDYPRCKSADITQKGICYLNSVREPLSSSPHFSFIDFECCDAAETRCQDKTVLPTGGPCPSGRIKWANPKEGSCVWGHDIASKGRMDIDSCRDFCWATPGCVSADLHFSGICYLNFVTTPVSNCKGYTLLEFECCPGPEPTCEKKTQTPTGSPCPSGHVIWKEPRAAMVVLGHDIASKAGMTIETCRDFCWSYPGCVSADLTSAGVCYLNRVTGPISKHNLFTLLEFECCKPNSEPACVNQPSASENSGPCHSGSAKFLDYQPGKVIWGHDLKVAYGQTVDSCRTLCWDTPNCKSADITYAGVCYLNRVHGPVGNSPLFSWIDFECCNGAPPTCRQQTVAPTGSPCPKGYVRWMDPKADSYVPGHDITSKAGMTLVSCRDLCWSYPGCVSADLTINGVCYLNYRKVPVAQSKHFMLLDFECCPEPILPTVTPPTVAPTQPPCTEDTKVDITFVLDGSGSIGADNYQQGLKIAVKGIIDYMLPAPGDTSSNSRVAAIVYSDKSVVQWNLDKYKSKNELFTAVDALPYYSSTTATGDALHDVLTQVHPKVRIGVKHLVILITDGESNDGTHVDTEEAQKLKDAKATVFVVGVGNTIKKDVLDLIASGPEYRADVDSYNDLAAKMKKLAIITCKEAVAE